MFFFLTFLDDKQKSMINDKIEKTFP